MPDLWAKNADKEGTSSVSSKVKAQYNADQKALTEMIEINCKHFFDRNQKCIH